MNTSFLSPSLRVFFKRTLMVVALLMSSVMGALIIAIVFGGPSIPAPLASINEPFRNVDFSALPKLTHYQAADGVHLAYRHYESLSGDVKGSIVLVHGSSATSTSMHVMASAFAKRGFEVCALDIRGHGQSGTKGTIKYVGQLENDLVSFVQAVPLKNPVKLVGFSAGAGFVLRFAGSPHQDIFDSYVLLSPYLGSDAPNYSPNGGGWVAAGIPRIISLGLMNRLGIHHFNDLPVINFALDESAKQFLTTSYSFSLASNFGPLRDYEANIKAVHRPVAIIAGASDEVFLTNMLEGIFRKQGKTWPVTLVPEVGHIELTLDADAVNTVVEIVQAFR